MARGLAGAMAASRARKAGKADTLPITERDIPIGIVGLVTLICMLPIGWLLGYFGNSSGLGAHLPTLIIGGVAYVVLMSFFVSAVCGYMAGLIGSSNSPLSGIGILVVIGAALLLVIGVKPYVSPDASKALMAFALFTTAVIFNVAAIANNNLQDLKTGQLVDATPWKQQVALIFGVIAGAFVIPPVLDLVNHAYGFVGAPGAEPRPHPLPAPQAGLISSLAQGVIAADIDWSLIRIGGLIGVGIILLDEILARTTRHMRVPPLAVGLGIYLPTQSTLMIVVGAVAGWLFDRRADRTAKPEATKQLGVLLASGLIVGEGIIGVVISAIIVFSGKDCTAGAGRARLRNRWQIPWRISFRGDCDWALSLDPADGAGEIAMKRRWNWPIWVGFLVVARRAVLLRVLRAVSNHARFSMGESFALWNWGCVVDRRLVPRVWPAASLSRKDFRLDLHSDCCACWSRFSVTKSFTCCDRCRLQLARRASGKKRRISHCRIKMENRSALGDLLLRASSKAVAADFLSRFLVTAMQLRVAEFSGKASGVRGAWHSRCRHQRRSAGY